MYIYEAITKLEKILDEIDNLPLEDESGGEITEIVLVKDGKEIVAVTFR